MADYVSVFWNFGFPRISTGIQFYVFQIAAQAVIGRFFLFFSTHARVMTAAVDASPCELPAPHTPAHIMRITAGHARDALTHCNAHLHMTPMCATGMCKSVSFRGGGIGLLTSSPVCRHSFI